MDMLQATRKAVWKQFGKGERWEMEPTARDEHISSPRRDALLPIAQEPTARDEHVSFPRRDTGSDLRVKKVRFCDAEPMQIQFPTAQKRIYEKW